MLGLVGTCVKRVHTLSSAQTCAGATSETQMQLCTWSCSPSTTASAGAGNKACGAMLGKLVGWQKVSRPDVLQASWKVLHSCQSQPCLHTEQEQQAEQQNTT